LRGGRAVKTLLNLIAHQLGRDEDDDGINGPHPDFGSTGGLGSPSMVGPPLRPSAVAAARPAMGTRNIKAQNPAHY